MFFEILDFVTSVKALQVYPDGWNRIAWGFLRLVGGDGSSNTDTKARIQLYKYPKKIKPVTDGSAFIYQCWKLPWVKYPSTLYVKVSGYKSLEMTRVTERPTLPSHIEYGKIPIEIVILILS